MAARQSTEPRWGHEKIFWWSRYYDVPTFVSLRKFSGDLGYYDLVTSLSRYYDWPTSVFSRTFSGDPLNDTRAPENIHEETKVGKSY